MPTFESSLQAAIGTRYQLRGLVAEGGMGRVFEAWDTKHNRHVAVKVTVGTRFDEGAPAEVDVVSRLRHPAILPLFDSGEDDGFVYFIMPFVHADSVRTLLEREGRPERSVALQILSDVAGALDYAHSHGVVHRDIKPENVLMESGRGVVADFGIALTMGWDRTRETGSSGEAGTAPYMSPEQMLEPAEVGPATDVYALGCLAYELLTGDRPFRAGNTGAVAALKLQGATGVGKALGTIPAGARRHIVRALSPDPSERPASAAKLVEGVREGLDRRRHQLWWVTGAAGALVAASFLVPWRSPAPGPVLDEGRVVVGPIVDRSAGGRLTPLAVSAVDHLTRNLQNTGLIQVVPTESALGAARFVLSQLEEEAIADPITSLGAETGAGIVVSGEVVAEGGRIGLRLRITDAVRGVLLSAPEPTFVSSDAPADLTQLLQTGGSQLMGALAVVLDDRLGAFARGSVAPTFEAYRPFSEGLERYLTQDYPQAIPLFEEALAADTTFVAPAMYAALSHSNLGQYAAEDSILMALRTRGARLTTAERQWLDFRTALLAGDRANALRAIRAAAAAAPGSKAVYNLGVEAMEGRRLRDALGAFESLPVDRGPVRGLVSHLGGIAVVHHLLGEYRPALDAARQARTLFPDYLAPRLWELGALAALGRSDDVLGEAAVVLTLQKGPAGLEPADVLAGAAMELAAHGHDDAAISLWQDVVLAVESRNGDVGPRTQLALGEAYLALSRVNDARDVAARLEGLKLPGLASLQVLAFKGRVAARTGDRQAAEAILERLDETPGPYLFGVHQLAAAMVATALGDEHRALEFLRRGFADGLPYGDWAHNHPAFRSLWASPEYQALVAPVE